MTLLDCVRYNRDELVEGVLWICFYKHGRSWDSGFFSSYLFDDPSMVDDDEKEELAEIREIDPDALLFNGYESCFCTEDLSLHDLAELIRDQYVRKATTVSDLEF